MTNSGNVVQLGVTLTVLLWTVVLLSHSANAALTPDTTSQTLETVTLSYYVVGETSGFTPPVLNYVQNGVSESARISTQPTAYLVDYLSQWSVSSAISGGIGERWATNQESSGIVDGPISMRLVYYQQYAIEESYVVLNGNSPASPSIRSVAFGSPIVLFLTQGAETYWLDSGTSFSMTTVLAGSSSFERWVFNGTSTGQIEGPFSLAPTYFHQVLLSVTYLPPQVQSSEPLLSFISYGIGANRTLSSAPLDTWVDYGSKLTLYGQEVASAPGQRWIVENQVPRCVLSATTLNLVTVHQYLFQFSYGVVGGGGPEQPTFSGNSFASPIIANLSKEMSAFWLDAGTSWNIPSTFSGTPTERWYYSGVAGGEVSAPLELNATYIHQFYVSIAAPPAGGTVGPATGWYKAGSSIKLIDFTSPNWTFGGWEGSGRGSVTSGNSTLQVHVNGPIVEIPIFDAMVTIYSGNWGSITYYLGTLKGKLSAGQATQVPVPAGTNVTIVAEPSSSAYTFRGWTGSLRTQSQVLEFKILGPTYLLASFDVNYAVVFGIIFVWALGVIGFFVYWLNRKEIGLRERMRSLISYLKTGA